MSISVKKKGKRYQVIDSQEGVMTSHNKKSIANLMAKEIRKMKSPMSHYSSPMPNPYKKKKPKKKQKYVLYGKSQGITKKFGTYNTRKECETASGVESINLQNSGYEKKVRWIIKKKPIKKSKKRTKHGK
jgi:hypothetical protein